MLHVNLIKKLKKADIPIDCISIGRYTDLFRLEGCYYRCEWSIDYGKMDIKPLIYPIDSSIDKRSVIVPHRIIQIINFITMKHDPRYPEESMSDEERFLKECGDD
ncbi:MAG: hypothetical protein LLG04_18840 [Parachlamydia sp.]|nr:hypothetical protein [Parachlamydia sp.]